MKKAASRIEKAAGKPSRAEFVRGLKGIAKSGRKYLPLMIVACILTIGFVVLSILAPQTLSDLTNEITDNAGTQTIDLERITRLGIILAAFYVSIALVNYLSSFIMTTVSQRYSQDLRTGISTKINRMPLAYFDSHAFGDVLSRLTNDVDQIGMSLQQSVSMLLQSVFMLVGVITAMFVTSWQMALTALLSLPLMIVFIALIAKVAMPGFRRRQAALGKVSGIVEENYSGQLVVKVFNAGERVNSEFAKENDRLGKAMFTAEALGGIMMPFMTFVSYFAYAAIFLVGGLLMYNDAGVSFGTIAAFMVYINLFQSPLAQLAQAVNSLQLAAAGAARVFGFLNEEELASEAGKTPRLLGPDGHEQVRGEVDFDQVHFSYIPGKEIIHGFSEQVKPGMKVAIVGPTGAGKTTIVNLLMRFYDVDSGKITIDGVPTIAMPRAEIRNIFGMVLQDTWIFRGTIRENIVYNTPDVTDGEINQVLEDANLAHYVSTLPGGLDYEIKEADEISAGQKQLLTIARAMVKKAPLMILDEATSNVDTRTEEKIQDAMDKLMKGRTSFVIAHRLSTIRNADIILVMKDGNIIEQGNHEELMRQNGFYASLYNSQFSFE